ncbi:hypothetical protein A6P54_13050 [Bacillus sp. MKU004]|nr:hypothetical protein A6P54_13050 [Bacillus sp. MKU004]
MTKFEKLLSERIDRLESEIKRLKTLYDKTLKYQGTDPEVSLFQARKSAEAICKAIYIKEGLHRNGKPLTKLMLNELIQLLDRNGSLPKHISINLGTIQAFGNFGSHDQGEDNDVITADYIQPCLLALGTVFNWYVEEYHSVDQRTLLSEVNTALSADEEVVTETQQNLTKKELPVLKVIGNHAPPYRIYSREDAGGIYYEIMNEVARRLDIRLEYEKQPFKTSLMKMKSGEADIMVGPNISEERKGFMEFSKVTLPAERKAFFVHFTGTPITAYEDLYNRTVIISRGKTYTDEFDADINLKKVKVTDYEQGFRLLENNPQYVMIMPEKEGEYIIDANGYDVLSSPFYLDGKPSYIAFSKKSAHKDIFADIEEVVCKLKEDGTYQEIVHYY